MRALREAFLSAAADERVRCVVLTGAGGHFCAGADLRKNMEDPEMMARSTSTWTSSTASSKRSCRCPKPTVAMVDGAAVGFGADLALACDLRVVADARTSRRSS